MHKENSSTISELSNITKIEYKKTSNNANPNYNVAKVAVFIET